MKFGKAHPKYKHGMTHSSEFNTWNNILQRCENPKAHNYKYYGGRGIKVCERWHKFEHFIADMERKPSPKYSIERMDNDGNYEPDNCKWATPLTQMHNRRNTVGMGWPSTEQFQTLWNESIDISEAAAKTSRNKHQAGVYASYLRRKGYKLKFMNFQSQRKLG